MQSVLTHSQHLYPLECLDTEPYYKVLHQSCHNIHQSLEIPVPLPEDNNTLPYWQKIEKLLIWRRRVPVMWSSIDVDREKVEQDGTGSTMVGFTNTITT
jgi:hypothetical protein